MANEKYPTFKHACEFRGFETEEDPKREQRLFLSDEVRSPFTRGFKAGGQPGSAFCKAITEGLVQGCDVDTPVCPVARFAKKQISFTEMQEQLQTVARAK